MTLLEAATLAIQQRGYVVLGNICGLKPDYYARILLLPDGRAGNPADDRNLRDNNGGS